jgi:hypothetical protein
MLVVEHNFVSGVPQTAVQGFAPHGIGWHWDAGLGGRAGWDATVRYLIGSRYTTNASYHLGFWHEHDPGGNCVTVAQWIVRPTVAAHSLAPSQAFVAKTGSDLEQERFADVRRILEREWDPNADIVAAAYSGMPAGLAVDMECEVFRADVRKLARDLEMIPTLAPGPHFGHGWIQPSTRYEMDAPGAPDFFDMIAPLAEPEPTPDPEPIPPPPPTREERLAAEVIALRSRHPQQAAHWANSAMTQANDGKPLTREMRLAGEALYLRRVATGTDNPTQ